MSNKLKQKNIFNSDTDAAFYICPQCGNPVAEQKIARDVLFCSRSCFLAFKAADSVAYANYRRYVLDIGIGRGPKGILPKSVLQGQKPFIEWPTDQGPLRAAFDRVHDLEIFFNELAEKEGRCPVRGERLARLMRLAQKK